MVETVRIVHDALEHEGSDQLMRLDVSKATREFVVPAFANLLDLNQTWQQVRLRATARCVNLHILCAVVSRDTEVHVLMHALGLLQCRCCRQASALLWTHRKAQAGPCSHMCVFAGTSHICESCAICCCCQKLLCAKTKSFAKDVAVATQQAWMVRFFL